MIDVGCVEPVSANTPSHLWDHLRQYGNHSLAYSVVSDLSVHAFMAERGCVAFGTTGTPFGQHVLVCGDPLCDAESQKEVIESFASKYPSAAFWQVRYQTAQVLSSLGYRTAVFGTETDLDLQEWTASGTRKQNIRTALNRAHRESIEIIEATPEEIGVDLLKQVSDSWIKSKTVNTREITFLARPARLENEPDVRKFFARKDGHTIAFAFFDPVYEQGSIIGYAANILRARPDATPGICDAIILSAMRFKEEQLRTLCLGLSPFRPWIDAGANHLSHSRAARKLFGLLWKQGNTLFGFQGLALHKSRWGGRDYPVYFATRNLNVFGDIVGLLRQTRVI